MLLSSKRETQPYYWHYSAQDSAHHNISQQVYSFHYFLHLLVLLQ